MQIKIFETPEELGKAAAREAAKLLNDAINQKGSARLLLSTGQSQFEFFDSFVKEDIEWDKVEVFHLDEYIGITEEHPASFVKYLKERFISLVNPGKVHFVDPSKTNEDNIRQLSEEITKKPVDVAMIGIGRNAHIGFNDPPANFETRDSFMVVTLDEKCRMQQVGEGWFNAVEDVPEKAITITVHQIMQSNHILSCVPHQEKAEAVKNTVEGDLDNNVPATMLKSHPSWTLYLEKESASLLSD